jgi:chemotaxis protein methyltransferase CheR
MPPDQQWIDFLQWALPRFHMRWQGFRKVRGQVIKRIGRRLQHLNLSGPSDYQAYLQQHPEEWDILDGLCRVAITRFYRDRLLFVQLEQQVLPELATRLRSRGHSRLRVWSAGCASGEEPYSVAIVWQLRLQALFPDISLDLLATDADSQLLRRANVACYPHSSIKNLPLSWREQVFGKKKDQYCLRPLYKKPVRLRQHDIRAPLPEGPFHLILCRNLVFTYFDRELQLTCLKNFAESLLPGGYLIVSVREQPAETPGFTAVSRRLGIYQKTA